MTTDPKADLCNELGLTADSLREVARVTLPSGGIASGRSSQRGAASALSENFVALGPTGDFSFLLTRHVQEPSVVRIENAVAVVAIGGAAERHDDTVLLDGRGGHPALAVIEDAEGRMLIEIDDNLARIFRIDVPEDLSGLDAWVPPPSQLAAPAPSLATLLGASACEGWLRDRIETLARSSWLVDQVAAIGTLFRHFTPAGPGDAAPLTAASAWFRALSPAERDAVERLAVQQAASLRDRIEALADAEDDPSPTETLDLVYERDALESVLALLWVTSEGRALGAELALVDDAALTALSNFAPSDVVADDELVRTVFTTEPDAWWGTFTGG